MWLFKQKPEYLDALAKYHSCTSGLGKNYVEPRKVNGAACCGGGLGWAVVLPWSRNWARVGHGEGLGLSARLPGVPQSRAGGWELLGQARKVFGR